MNTLDSVLDTARTDGYTSIPEREENQLLFITGMSGAGRKTAAATLEEMGWYVVDNIPAELVEKLIELQKDPQRGMSKMAIVSDPRASDFKLAKLALELKERGQNLLMMYLDATDDMLITRFDSVRRSHPLQGAGTVQTGLARERELLEPERLAADIYIDTTELSVHDLRHRIEQSLNTIGKGQPHVTVESFGFKYGIPRDADLVLDARFLTNPYWVPELRAFRGTDKPVSDYVMSQPGAQDFVIGIEELLDVMIPGYTQEGKGYVTVAIGCTGGHHRSVATVEELARRLRLKDLDVSVLHRDYHRR